MIITALTWIHENVEVWQYVCLTLSPLVINFFYYCWKHNDYGN